MTIAHCDTRLTILSGTLSGITVEARNTRLTLIPFGIVQALCTDTLLTRAVIITSTRLCTIWALPTKLTAALLWCDTRSVHTAHPLTDGLALFAVSTITWLARAGITLRLPGVCKAYRHVVDDVVALGRRVAGRLSAGTLILIGTKSVRPERLGQVEGHAHLLCPRV